MMKKSKLKYFEFIAYILILIGIVCVGLKTFFPSHYDKTVNKKLYVVLTDSMSPTIPPLSAVLVDLNEDHYQKGDIITFKVDLNQDGIKDLVTHRLESITDTEVRTISDKSNKIDRWTITQEDIIGKVVLTLPHLGGVILGVQKVAFPLLMIAMILIIALLLQTLNRWHKL